MLRTKARTDEENPSLPSPQKNALVNSGTAGVLCNVSAEPLLQNGSHTPSHGRQRNASICPFRSGVRFALHRGTTVWLNGPSGVGKSSVAKALVRALTKLAQQQQQQNLRDQQRLDSFTEQVGELGFGVQVSDWPSGALLGVVFQNPGLIDTLTVEENVGLALKLYFERSSGTKPVDLSKKNVRRLVCEELAQAGLDDTVLDKYPSEISLGMTRRVSLAMAMCQHPDLLIMDEPFASLDEDNAISIAQSIARKQHELGLAVLLISHLPNIACLLESTVIVFLEMNDQENNGAQKLLRWSQTSLVSKGLWAFRKARRGGPHLWQRALADWLFLMGLGLPLCFFAGAAAGAAGLSVVNALLRYVDIKILLGAVPDHIRENMVFSMFEGQIEDKGKEILANAKPKVLGSLLGYAAAVELAPLITGLVMAGIASAYFGGRVAALQATDQENVLNVLGFMRTWRWTLPPAIIAAVAASVPFFAATLFGTITAGVAVLDPKYVGSSRLKILVFAMDAVQDHNLNGGHRMQRGVLTYPPVIGCYRVLVFLIVIILSAELVTRKVVISRSAKDVSDSVAACVTASYVVALTAELAFAHFLLYTLNLPDPKNLLNLAKLFDGS